MSGQNAGRCEGGSVGLRGDMSGQVTRMGRGALICSVGSELNVVSGVLGWDRVDRNGSDPIVLYNSLLSGTLDLA